MNVLGQILIFIYYQSGFMQREALAKNQGFFERVNNNIIKYI